MVTHSYVICDSCGVELDTKEFDSKKDVLPLWNLSVERKYYQPTTKIWKDNGFVSADLCLECYKEMMSKYFKGKQW